MTSSRPQRDNLADQELLSAYLDDQLSGAERTLLERRLRSDQGLQGELEELRSFKLLLRNLPAVTPPRSFTIDPATVRRRGMGLFGWMRLGSALATMLLVLTFTADFIRGGGNASSANAPVNQAASGQSEAAAAPPAAMERQAPAAALLSGEAPTMAAAAAAPTSAPAMAAAAVEASPPSAAAGAAAPAAAAPAPAASPQSANDAALSAPAEAESQTDPTLKAAPDSTRQAYGLDPEAVGASENSSPGTHSSALPQPGPATAVLSPFRWAQLALGLAAVGLAIGAWATRRRR